MKTITTILFSLFFSISGIAQITFQKTYGASLDERGGSVQPTSDGGFILGGSSGKDLLLIKTDSNGTILWQKTFATTYQNFIFCLRLADDNSIVFAGADYSNNHGIFGKTDSLGNLLWMKNYAATLVNFYNVTISNDGGYLITGSADQDVLIIKTDQAGNSQWMKQYDFGSFDEAYCAQQLNDDGYIISGYAGDYAFALRTDSMGNISWSKTYNDQMGMWFTFLESVADGFIFTGSVKGFGAGGEDYTLIKTDTAGNILWAKSYGNTTWDFGWSVHQTEDLGYMIIGCTDYGATNVKISLIKTDSTGSIEFSKSYGGPGLEVAWRNFSGTELPGGGYIIGGNSDSFGPNLSELYLIRTDEDGNSGCNDTIETMSTGTGLIQVSSASPTSTSLGIMSSLVPVSGLTVTSTVHCFNSLTSIEKTGAIRHPVIYPNPADGLIQIEFQTQEKFSYLVMNSLGEIKITGMSQNNSIALDAIELSSGIYFIRIDQEENTFMKILVVNH